MKKTKKVAVLLCGSGFLDGSEIREAVAVLWALSSQGAEVHCFAPDQDQFDSVSHLSGQPIPDANRNMLLESARIARGEIESLERFQSSHFDALIIPGGFGVAKSLCTFGRDGAAAKVLPSVSAAIQSMAHAQKPIGAVCIAPVLVGLVLKGSPLQLTLGRASTTSVELEKLGHQHIECKTTDCWVDSDAKVVSTPAYMDDEATLSDVFTGVKKLVDAVLELSC
jgi:enhancing lycopene biosynthesis protein 2